MTTLIISAKEGVKFNMTEDIDLNPDSEDDFDTIPGTNLRTITNTSISGTLKRALGGQSTSLIVSNPTGTFVSTSSTTVGKVTINSTNISSCVKSKQGYPPGKYVDENGERVTQAVFQKNLKLQEDLSNLRNNSMSLFNVMPMPMV